MMRKDRGRMRKQMRKIAGVLTALMLLLSVAGFSVAPAEAYGPPEIRWQPSDMWLWTDETAYLSIYLENDAEYVDLQFYSSYYGDWTWLAPCSPSTPGDNKVWEAEIDPETWGDDYITLRFQVTKPGGAYFYSEQFTVNWTDETSFFRVAGDNRYKTAIEAADWFRMMMFGNVLSKYPNVVIACGTDFADALGGAYLASVYHAPILLVNKSPAVIQDIAGEIQKNMASDGMIFILGGYGAVPEDMESALRAGGFSDAQIERFAGKNRYDTNLKMLKHLGVHNEEILLCSGTGFADALSASAVGLPIMITGAKLTDEQLDYLDYCDPSALTIIGGEGAVSKEVSAQAKPLISGTVGRLYGNDRYGTSRAVALWYFSGKQRRIATLAYGQNFPDGLAGGPLSLAVGGPLLLVDDNHWQEADTALSSRNLGARDLLVMGGPTLISDKTVEKILEKDEVPDGPVGVPES